MECAVPQPLAPNLPNKLGAGTQRATDMTTNCQTHTIRQK